MFTPIKLSINPYHPNPDNPYEKNAYSAIEIENSKGKVISKGNVKARLFFSGLAREKMDDIGRHLAVAIKELGSKVRQQLDKAPKLGLIQRHFYLPALVQAEGEQDPVWVLINKSSFFKRFNVDKKEFNQELKQASKADKRQEFIQNYIAQAIAAKTQSTASNSIDG